MGKALVIITLVFPNQAVFDASRSGGKLKREVVSYGAQLLFLGLGQKDSLQL